MGIFDNQPYEAKMADCLWQIINKLQAMTERPLSQSQKSLRRQANDPYSLAALTSGAE